MSIYTEPTDSIDYVFRLIEILSNDPLKNFYGLKSYDARILEIFESSISQINTSCGITYTGLCHSLFGHQKSSFSIYTNLLFKKTYSKEDVFNILKSKVTDAMEDLENSPRGAFYWYGFELESAPMSELYCRSAHYSGHIFSVLQYIDDNGDPKYVFYQSFLSVYDLKTSIKEHKTSYTQEEFLEFLDGLEKFILEKDEKWELESEEFSKRYFHSGSQSDAVGMTFKNGIPFGFNMRKSSANIIRTYREASSAIAKFTGIDDNECC